MRADPRAQVAAALLLALAGCGVQDDPTPSAEPTATSTSLTPTVELRCPDRADVSMGGRSAHHYRARMPSFVVEGFGMSDAGHWVSLSFDLRERVPAQQRREIVESVVATYESGG